MVNNRRLTAAILLSATAFGAYAQSRGPAAQYWVDLSTSNVSMPGMPDEGSAGAGLLGGLMGGNAFGGSMGMGMSRGKWLDAELYVRANSNGVDGTHAIPSVMNMGPSLLLTPIRPKQSTQGSTRTSRDESTEKPKGRILLYWGCGETVRPGQPKILDFAKQEYGEYAQFFASHGAPSKGVQGRPGHSIWPNERDSKRVPNEASLLGDHAVTGDGVPASLKFTVGAGYDFLPKVQLSTKGEPKDSVLAQWQTMQNAKAYFLTAQGGAESANGAHDMILWSSSEKPDNGWALMTYQSPAQITKLLQQKVVLPPSTANCAIPKAIFEKAQGAMLNMIAYGPELNLSHPQRPQKAPADWQPEWTARVRIKSTGMTMLGMEDGGSERSAGRQSAGAGGDADATSPLPSVPNPLNLLKGIFSN
ncbi:hypothetical protein D3870_03165 [Noviherbaspirillum cavernae]|uniref:Uncharacterized protein n=1 Tax=Noviherbaspirillum cavernae TaxID=2320862 RepID=A0A418WY36_9BURK|nr:hypothetical protein [Noviherbaspirillum cavernae]RJG05149.1 hypothetical protein D3870_03165 [Noviherbaspirillum cavernae]